ncbi:MAG: polar amino acid transport system substrate-binding protein [Oceanospirillaceae bacterium]|jgi:polar amino acid transport system substrate-binding protein
MILIPYLIILAFVFSSHLMALPIELNFLRATGSTSQLVAQKLMTEIYRRADVKVNVTSASAKRAFSESSSGHSDGQLLRIAGADILDPSLIRIPTPIYHIETQIFARKEYALRINKVEDLREYKIAAVRGILHSKRLIDTAGATKVHLLENVTQLIKFVELGRADIAITGKLNGRHLIRAQNLNNIVEVGKPLFTYPLYHYLHQDYQWLAPKINTIVKEMKDSGELQLFISLYEKQSLN